jgi:chaperonin GroEL
MGFEGYAPKDLVFESEGRNRLIDGIVKLSRAVKSTLGPGGNTVLIESPFHTHGITVTKDGITVARSIDLMDPVENLAVRMVKEAGDKTATSAGDGTSTSILLVEALTLLGTKLITENVNRTAVLREMVLVCDDVVERLKKRSQKVTPAMLQPVATISANNDKNTGRIIAEAYKAVGKNGIVTSERSQTGETYAEVTTGVKISRGYTSPIFINDQKKDECILDDVKILVCDMEISNVLQIQNVLAPIIGNGDRILIIAPCSQFFLNALGANVVKGVLKCCVVQPPDFGWRSHELMQDLALSVGAKYFSEKTGDDLSLITYADLGHASKIIADASKTIVVKSELSSNPEGIDERVDQLRGAHKIAPNKHSKDFIMERIASLTGGIGVIYVGGNTDLEQKELYDRVDDAVCAVRSALEEGILAGAGVPLYEIAQELKEEEVKDAHHMIATKIIAEAIEMPLKQILWNAGLDSAAFYKQGTPTGSGYDLKSGSFGDLVQMGVIDPLKVTRSALQNAVSVAITILSTNAIVTMGRTMEIGDLNQQPKMPNIASARIIS